MASAVKIWRCQQVHLFIRQQMAFMPSVVERVLKVTSAICGRTVRGCSKLWKDTDHQIQHSVG